MKLPILDAKPIPVLVFLQNAWSPLYAGGVWPRPSWLKALERSRSGTRLKLLVDDLDLVENTTPIVGDSPSSVVEPDVEYVTKIIERRRPRVIIACGKQAETVLAGLWPAGLIVVPHPACRILTNELYINARRLAGGVTTERIGIRQAKGKILYEMLDGQYHEGIFGKATK